MKSLALLFLLLSACSTGSASLINGGPNGENGGGGGSGGAYTCPTVGSKDCPNDDPAEASDVALCNKCITQIQAYATCLGISHATCGADGKSMDISTPANCQTQYDAVTTCATAAVTSKTAG